MLVDVVLNTPIPDIFRECRLPQSFFNGADEGGSVVISKQERFNWKLRTASISGIVELLELEIEIFVGSNAYLDDGPDKTVSSQVAQVKGSCILQLLVRGVSVKCLVVNDRCTLNHLIITRGIFWVLQAEGNVITVRLWDDTLANHSIEGNTISVTNHTQDIL